MNGDPSGRRTTTPERSDARGCCADCSHARVVRSAKGSIFTLCERSFAEPTRFAKYPRLPVLRCEGYEVRTPARDFPR
jgi:hypothetical protein